MIGLKGRAIKGTVVVNRFESDSIWKRFGGEIWLARQLRVVSPSLPYFPRVFF